MIDCSDRKRLEETGNELTDLLMDSKLKGVPLLVFANKQDVTNALTASEVAECLGLVKLKDLTWQIQECSAIEGTGIKVSAFQSDLFQLKVTLSFHLLQAQEGMDWVCKCIKKK